MWEKVIELFSENISPGMILIIIIVGLLLGGRFFRFRFFDFTKILKDYAKCYRNAKGKIGMCIHIIAVPACLAWMAVTKTVIDAEAMNIVTIIVSIFTSMLFTLLGFFAGMKEKFDEVIKDSTRHSILSDLLKETHYTVMFEILVSIVILLFCFMTIFTGTGNEVCEFDSWIIYFLSFVLIINLFMVLKRISSLFDEWLK